MTIHPQPIPPELVNNGLPAPEEEAEVEEIEEVEQPKVEERGDDMSDLFEPPNVTDNDMETDDLVEVTEEDVMGGDSDMSDLVDVSHADLMGDAPKRKPKTRQIRRTTKRYIPPPSLGGMNL